MDNSTVSCLLSFLDFETATTFSVTANTRTGSALTGAATFSYSRPLGLYRLSAISCSDQFANSIYLTTRRAVRAAIDPSLDADGLRFQPALFDYSPPEVQELVAVYDETLHQANVSLLVSDDASGVVSCLLQYTNRPNGLDYAPLSKTITLPQAETRATFEYIFFLAPLAPAGDYPVQRIVCTDLTGRQREYTFDDVATSAALDNGFTRMTPGDELRPVISAVRLLNATVNTTLGAQAVAVDITVTDDVSGVVQCSLVLAEPTVYGNTITLHTSGNLRLAGQEHTLTAEGTLPRLSAQGMWAIQRVTCIDGVGRDTVLSPPQNSQAVAVPLAAVHQQGPGDAHPPLIGNMTATPTRFSTADADVDVVFTLHASDDLSGVAACTLQLTGEGPASPLGVTVPGKQVMRNVEFGTAAGSPVMDVSLTATMNFPRYGTYALFRVVSLTCTDRTGKIASVSRLAGGLAQALQDLTIEQTSVGDQSAPEVVSVTVGPDVDTSASIALVDVHVQTRDDFAGIARCAATLAPVNAETKVEPIEVFLPGNSLVTAGPSSTNLSASVALLQYLPHGFWYLQHIRCSDNLGRQVSLTAADFYRYGLVTSVEEQIGFEQRGAGDEQPPTVVGARFDREEVSGNVTAVVNLVITVSDDVSGVQSCFVTVGGYFFAGSADLPTRAGTVTVPIDVRPRSFFNGGVATLDEVKCFDLAGRATVQNDFPANVSFRVPVFSFQTAAVTDIVVELGNNQLTAASFNTSSMAVPLVVRQRVQANGGAPVRECYARVAPRLQDVTLASAAALPLTLVQGTREDGVWEGRGFVPAGAAAGQYTLSTLCSNYATGVSSSFLPGAPTVTQVGAGDGTTPTIRYPSAADASLTRQDGVGYLASVNLTAEERSPLSFCSATLRHKVLSTLHYTLTSPLSLARQPSSFLEPGGSQTTSRLTVSALLPLTLPFGGYFVEYASCADVWGNTYDSARPLGFPFSPTIINQTERSVAAIAPEVTSLVVVSPSHQDLRAGVMLDVTIALASSDGRGSGAPINGCLASWIRSKDDDSNNVDVIQTAASYSSPVTAPSVTLVLRVPPTYTATPWRLGEAVCWDVNGLLSEELPTEPSHRLVHTGPVDLRSPAVAIESIELQSVEANTVLLPAGVSHALVVRVRVTDDVSGVARCRGEVSLRPLSGAPSALPFITTQAYATSHDAAGLPLEATLNLTFPLPPTGASAEQETRLFIEALRCTDGQGRFATLLGLSRNTLYTPPAPTAAASSLSVYGQRLRAWQGPLTAHPDCAQTDHMPPAILDAQPYTTGSNTLAGEVHGTLLLRVVDDASGVAHCVCTLLEETSNEYLDVTTDVWPPGAVYGATAVHTFAITATYPRDSSHVQYSLVNSTCVDGAGNVATSGPAWTSLRPSRLPVRVAVESNLRRPPFGNFASNDKVDRLLPLELFGGRVVTAAVNTSAAPAVVVAELAVRSSLTTPFCNMRLCPPVPVAVGELGQGASARSKPLPLRHTGSRVLSSGDLLLTLSATMPQHALQGAWLACEVTCTRNGVGRRYTLTGRALADVMHDAYSGVVQVGDGDGIPPLVTEVSRLAVADGAVWVPGEPLAVEATLHAADAGSGLAACTLSFVQTALRRLPLATTNETCQLAAVQAFAALPDGHNLTAGTAVQAVALHFAVVFPRAGAWQLDAVRCVDHAGNVAQGPRSRLGLGPSVLMVSSARVPPPSDEGGGGGGVAVAAAAAVVLLLLLVLLVVFWRRRKTQRGAGGRKRSASTPVAAFAMATRSEVREARAQSISQRHNSASQFSREGMQDLAVLR